jgi:hypothetical protein
MEGEFKVRAVEFEEKSKVEIEEQLLKEHEDKLNEEQTGTPEQTSTEPTPTPDIDDNIVLSHIKTRYNKEISSLDELFEQRNQNEELPEDVAAFLKYKKETGRNIDDFIKLNKDYSNVDPDTLLFEFYKEQNPDLDPDDVKFEIGLKFGYDEDLDDEKEIKQKKLAFKKELTKAKKHFDEQKEQYKMPLESRDTFVPDEEKESYESFKSYRETASKHEEEQAKRSKFFADKTSELFSDKFEGFGFNIDESNKMVYKPADANTLIKEQSNIMDFISKFLNEDGYLKDAEAFHKAIAVANNPDKFAKYFYEKGKAEAVGDIAKESKNIDMARTAPTPTPKQGTQVRVIDEERGNRLIIRKPFKN